MAKATTKSNVAQRGYVPGTSRRREGGHTVLLRMAMEAQRQAEIGLRLKELRGRRPQRVIADAVPVTLRAYQAWEAGDSSPSWPHLEKLGEFHGVSTAYLLHGDEDQPMHGTQLDRLEKKVDALLSVVNAMSRVLDGHDKAFRDRIAKVGAQVDWLDENVRARYEELRQEDAAEVARALEAATPAPEKRRGGNDAKPRRRPPEGR